LKYGIGLHVDSCLGGFIVNNLKQHQADYLRVPGVTSMSIDTHKNGWAPKGSSVLITRPIEDRVHHKINLAYYSVYSIPGWSGGVYGTPKDAGSQPVTNALHALIAMLAVGKNGYLQLAQGIHQAALAMAAIIKQIPQLELLGEPHANVVAWRAAKNVWSRGAVYALAHEMGKRGFVVNALAKEKLHFCVTGRSAGDAQCIQKFETALRHAITEVDALDQEVRAGRIKFAGSAGMYGMLEAALTPESVQQSRGEYWQNVILGQRGAVDSVKGYYMGVLDPYTL